MPNYDVDEHKHIVSSSGIIRTMESQYHDVGDTIKYSWSGAPNPEEHQIHGVRYERDNTGLKVNVRYLVRLEFKDHDIPVPQEVFHKEGASDQVIALLEKRNADPHNPELNKQIDDLHEHDKAIIEGRIKAIRDSHQHDLLCPIVEREVWHTKVIEKVA